MVEELYNSEVRGSFFYIRVYSLNEVTPPSAFFIEGKGERREKGYAYLLNTNIHFSLGLYS